MQGELEALYDKQRALHKLRLALLLQHVTHRWIHRSSSGIACEAGAFARETRAALRIQKKVFTWVRRLMRRRERELRQEQIVRWLGRVLRRRDMERRLKLEERRLENVRRDALATMVQARWRTHRALVRKVQAKYEGAGADGDLRG